MKRLCKSRTEETNARWIWVTYWRVVPQTSRLCSLDLVYEIIDLSIANDEANVQPTEYANRGSGTQSASF
jgi:hypothetical protein